MSRDQPAEGHGTAPAQSLKHAYELYVEQEIENYKFSLPRPAILRIGDEAVSALRDRTQPEFDELVLCSEVDRIVSQRLRIPNYSSWRKRRLKLLAQYRKPEHWGLAADAPLVCEIVPDTDSRVLGGRGTARGSRCCTWRPAAVRSPTLEDNEEAVERVVTAASQVGLMSRVKGQPFGLDSWALELDAPLNAVVVSPAAFQGLTPEQRTRAIDLLKLATLEGGVHLVHTLGYGRIGRDHGRVAGALPRMGRLGGARRRRNRTFLARKSVA